MIRPLRLGRWALFVVLALTAFPASAQTTYTWTGSGSDANWSTAGNWTASAGSPRRPATSPIPSSC